MELNFAKTAPGVMTASWTHPKKGRQYSVAIIESCDTQHLFIDGELIARELPNFDDAVTLAKQKLNTTQSSQLVRIAGALVIASVIGASVVVASKYLPAITPAEIAAAASTITSDTKSSSAQNDGAAPTVIATKIQAVSKPTIAETTPAAAPTVEKTAGSSEHVTASNAETKEQSPLASAVEESDNAETEGRRRFSARNNLLALEAHLAKERAVVTQATAEITEPKKAAPSATTASKAEPAKTLNAKPTQSTALVGPTPPVTPTSAAASEIKETAITAPIPQVTEAAPKAIAPEPLIRPMLPKTTNSDDVETQSDLIAERPPLPIKAPALVKASMKIAAHQDSSESMESTASSSVTAPAKPHAAPQRKRTTRAAIKSRRKVRKSSRRLPRKARRSSPRRVVTAAPQKRLVCFAHVCRWR